MDKEYMRKKYDEQVKYTLEQLPDVDYRIVLGFNLIGEGIQYLDVDKKITSRTFTSYGETSIHLRFQQGLVDILNEFDKEELSSQGLIFLGKNLTFQSRLGDSMYSILSYGIKNNYLENNSLTPTLSKLSQLTASLINSSELVVHPYSEPNQVLVSTGYTKKLQSQGYMLTQGNNLID